MNRADQLRDENAKLRDENAKLRDENARLSALFDAELRISEEMLRGK